MSVVNGYFYTIFVHNVLYLKLKILCDLSLFLPNTGKMKINYIWSWFSFCRQVYPHVLYLHASLSSCSLSAGKFILMFSICRQVYPHVLYLQASLSSCSLFAGKFIATCLPPVPTRGLTANDVTDLTENVRKMMLETFNQTTFEATQNKLASKISNGAKQ